MKHQIWGRPGLKAEARLEGTVEGRATRGKVQRHSKGRDMTRQDKWEGDEEDEIEGSDGRKKVST